MCELGVDVIFGSHPHVIQPSEIIDENTGKRTICLFPWQLHIKPEQGNPERPFRTPVRVYGNGVLVWLDITKLPSGRPLSARLSLYQHGCIDSSKREGQGMSGTSPWHMKNPNHSVLSNQPGSDHSKVSYERTVAALSKWLKIQ